MGAMLGYSVLFTTDVIVSTRLRGLADLFCLTHKLNDEDGLCVTSAFRLFQTRQSGLGKGGSGGESLFVDVEHSVRAKFRCQRSSTFGGPPGLGQAQHVFARGIIHTPQT